MTHKIVIAKDGYDALTETDPNNLKFSSDYNTLKYFTSGSLQVNVSAGANTFYHESTSVNHNLGYLPFYITYGNQPKSMTGYAPVGISYTFTDDGVGNDWYRHLKSWVTSTKLYVAAEGIRDAAGDSYTATFYYKIFRNNLGL